MSTAPFCFSSRRWAPDTRAILRRLSRAAGARFAPFNRIVEPDKLSRSRISALVTRGLSSERDVYVMAANNAEGCAPLTLFELATAIAR